MFGCWETFGFLGTVVLFHLLCLDYVWKLMRIRHFWIFVNLGNVDKLGNFGNFGKCCSVGNDYNVETFGILRCFGCWDVSECLDCCRTMGTLGAFGFFVEDSEIY